MNVVIPQAWIIEEKIRREQEKRRKEEENLIPISLPVRPIGREEFFDPDSPPKESDSKNETVVIIDL